MIEDIFIVPVEAYRSTFVKSLAMVPVRTSKPMGAIGNCWVRRHRASDDELRPPAEPARYFFRAAPP